MIVSLPYKILIDKNTKGKVADTLENLNFGKNCAIICTEHVQNICSTISSEVSSAFEVEMSEPATIEINHLKEMAKDVKAVDFIVGIGGGKSMDAAKYLAFLAQKPWVAIPTILSHDGVVSSRAIIDDGQGNWMSVTAQEPAAIIADLEVIKNAGYKYIASGMGDLLSNFSAVEDWKLADKAGKENYHEMMGKLSLISAEAVTKHIDDLKKKDYHALEVLFWSLVSSGFAMNIYGSSRPCSGSEHNISHMLDKLGSKALHGNQVALTSIISSYLQKGDWQKTKSNLEKAGLPVTAKELGVEDIIVEALVSAKNVRDRYTILNEVNVTKKKAEEVLKETGIIP